MRSASIKLNPRGSVLAEPFDDFKKGVRICIKVNSFEYFTGERREAEDDDNDFNLMVAKISPSKMDALCYWWHTKGKHPQKEKD